MLIGSHVCELLLYLFTSGGVGVVAVGAGAELVDVLVVVVVDDVVLVLVDDVHRRQHVQSIVDASLHILKVNFLTDLHTKNVVMLAFLVNYVWVRC